MARLHVLVTLSAFVLMTPAAAGIVLTRHCTTIQPSSSAISISMGKKTSWSIGKARQKTKKAKVARRTAAGLKGLTTVKGFGITKEKLAKSLGEMTAAEAIAFLSSPEPQRAGISDAVVVALRTEIINAVEAAKRTAVKEEEEEAAAERGPAAAESSDQATRKWREYCAQALAAAEKVELADGTGDAMPQPLFEPVDDVPLFKARGEAPAKPQIVKPPSPDHWSS